MRQPDPHLTSLSSSTFRSSSYAAWANRCTSVAEVVALSNLLSGVPAEWIEWAERRAVAVEARGVHIRKPLGYRITVLWNGIIHLQESKFICDALENTLREAANRCLSKEGVELGALLSSLPRNQEKQTSSRDSRAAAIPRNVDNLCSLSFYQLTELYARFWMTMLIGDRRLSGFRQVFVPPARCRSADAFRADMATIRHRRNDIAHSKKLPLPSETQELYRLACLWLSSLGLQLSDRVKVYRSYRPRFLRDLTLEERRLTSR